MSFTKTLSISEILDRVPWQPLESHLDYLKDRIDESITKSHAIRKEYREQLLSENPDLFVKIRRPSEAALVQAQEVFRKGIVAGSDGTISAVPLLAGSKIQVGVVIVSNRGDVVDLVTRVFETDLTNDARDAREFFSNLRSTRAISNLLSRAIMLFGERRLLIEHEADWRLIHGELIPHELRTGAGQPAKNLPPTFDLIRRFIDSERFIAVTEASDDIDILNAAILLQPCEYLEIKTLEHSLTEFLDGNPETGQAAANFAGPDRDRFRQFIQTFGPQVSIVLVKAGQKPFLLECHSSRVEEAVSVFLVDSFWVRGLPTDGTGAIRAFPFHIDLADQIARTLFKGSDFRDIVESRLYELDLEAGLFDIDPRRTRS